MHIAVTGGTGFLGRYIVERLAGDGHALRCWRRAESDLGGFDEHADRIEWLEGGLGDDHSARKLVADCEAVVHSALWRPGASFQGGEGDIVKFVETNLVGTLRLIEAARAAGVGRFVFISTCAVHDEILGDRPLDETHPLWPRSHYGAHKAAIEKFVHSYGLGQGYPICALRPTGIYGEARPLDASKWHDLVGAVVRGDPVECHRGGKEVHAADVARAVDLLLASDAHGIAGQAYSCYDMYVSEFDIATLAKQLTGSDSQILGGQTRPKNEIVTEKIRGLGMTFGGRKLFERTIRALAEAHKP
jgi:nucleoside-diphosphate-sugar epimerase